MDNSDRAETVQPLPEKQKSHEIFRFTASTVDIPNRWNPRAKQSRTVALLAALCAATLFEDGTTLAIDCIAIEDEYGNTPAQRAELDWLLYNKPLEYAQMVLKGEMERYLSLGCEHGRSENCPCTIRRKSRTCLNGSGSFCALVGSCAKLW